LRATDEEVEDAGGNIVLGKGEAIDEQNDVDNAEDLDVTCSRSAGLKIPNHVSANGARDLGSWVIIRHGIVPNEAGLTECFLVPRSLHERHGDLALRIHTYTFSL
jgi:hypothetical protein